jgi:cytochrome c-type biogenesis protein
MRQGGATGGRCVTLIFAFLAGVLTLLNPCVLPVLPIVLASALQAHRGGPVALVAGMGISFVGLGLTVAVLGKALGLTSEILSNIGAAVMLGFGLVLLVPGLGQEFTALTAGFAARADARIDGFDRGGLVGQALTGALLGAVWSPCVGPTLGSAVALAATGESLGFAASVMTAFVAGVAVVMLVLAYAARAALLRWRGAMRVLAGWAKPVLGAVLVVVGLAILTSWHQRVEGLVLAHVPVWMQDLSVAY